MLNAMLGLGLIVLVAVAALAGRSVDDEWGALLGALVGLAVGVPAVVRVHRRRNPA